MKTFSLCLLLLLNFNLLAQQPGSLDFSFNPNDTVYNLRGFQASGYGNVKATAIQADGKILVGGTFYSVNNLSRYAIVRYNTDGTLDTSFAAFNTSAIVNSIAVQNDGKIIIAGAFDSNIQNIARLNIDGTIDTTFNPGTGTNYFIDAVALQNDGKILVGGFFTIYNGDTVNHIVRLNPDGSRDYTFITGPGTSARVMSFAVQNDGKIVIAGNFGTYFGVATGCIIRLHNDGRIDTSFTPGAGPLSPVGSTQYHGDVYATALQNDGKIVIAGRFKLYSGFSRNNIARINSDGSLDTSFDPGTGTDSIINSVSLQPDGKIIIGGHFTLCNGIGRNNIARLNSNGSVDGSFVTGNGPDDFVEATAVEGDGKIIAGGNFTAYNGRARSGIACINIDGSLHSSFNLGQGVNSYIAGTTIQPDDKIIIGGDFISCDGMSRNHIARLNADGTVDLSFNPGTGTNQQVSDVVTQTDGKILIAGSFTTYNRISRKGVARLNIDGSLDQSFIPGLSGNFVKIEVQSDGKILLCGDYIISGNSRSSIVRLNTDGSVDGSFTAATGADAVSTMCLQKDGKILITGFFTSISGISRYHLARLNSDGSLDATFDPGSGADYISRITMQSDGKIIIIGGFLLYNGTSINNIARLNSNGSLDLSFNPGLGTGGPSIQAVTIQSDGKFIISGSFTAYNGVIRKRLARLHVNGLLDTTFNPGAGLPFYASRISFQSTGKIIISGSFTTYNGTIRNRIARLYSGLPAGLEEHPNASNAFTIFPNPSSGSFTVTSDINLKDAYCTITDAAGKYVSSHTLEAFKTNLNLRLSDGVYFIQIADRTRQFTKRIAISSNY